MEEKTNNFPKEGFARLIRSFENTEDVVKLTRAFGLATKIHKNQLFNKELYINHPLRVAMILVEELQVRDTDLICAALLHDAADASQEEVQECGDRVYSITQAGMEPKDRPDDKEKALEQYYAKMARASKDAKCVKVADKLDSVRSMKGQAIKAAKYKEEMEKYVVPLANGTDDRLAFKLSVALYELK
ncbi:MAG TPA: HD domain-containing protein [Nitrososphaera sp.]|jgi:GTP pyrophosphokinase|nr:HD domain-containing protein [Nitrososphaera sp.]